MDSKFFDVPSDPNTKIINQKVIAYGDITALLEEWVWDGISGKSLIFFLDDIDKADPKYFIEKFLDKVLIEDKFTVSSNEAFYFINFDFKII